MANTFLGLAEVLAGLAVGIVGTRMTLRRADRRAASNREETTLRDLQRALPDAYDATIQLVNFLLVPASERDNQAAGHAADAYLRTSRDAYDRAASLPPGELREQVRTFSFLTLTRLFFVASDTAQGIRKPEDLRAEMDAGKREFAALRTAISERLSAMSQH